MRAYLLIGILIIFAISECHLKSVAEESYLENQGDSLEQSIFSEHKPEGHRRHKRFISAVIGVAKGLLGAVKFGLGIHNARKKNAAMADIQRSLAKQGDDIADVQRSLAKQGDDIADIQDSLAQHHRDMADVKIKLQDLDGQLDSLSKDVESLKQLVSDGNDRLLTGQERMQASCHYGKDVTRLRFFLSHLNEFLTLQNDTSLGPLAQANAWADDVLKMGEGGVAQVLYEFHNMIIGNNPLFGHRPIFSIFENGLDRDSPSYWRHVTEITEFLYSIQVAGYMVWFTSLNIKDRHEEVANVQRLAMGRFNEQERIMEPLMLEWPNGTYGLPMTDTGCPLSAGVQWQNGTRHQHTQCCSTRGVSGIHFPTGFHTNYIMKQHFCMKTGTGGRGSWPKGNYCLFMKGDTCPSGFSFGFMRWDDENDNHANRVSGSLPDGKYDRDTLIFFCCRSDGPSSTPIDLPSQKPFYLFKYQSDSECQEVRGMKVKEEWFYWDTEDSHNHSFVYGAHPYTPSTSGYFKIYYCYYHS